MRRCKAVLWVGARDGDHAERLAKLVHLEAVIAHRRRGASLDAGGRVAIEGVVDLRRWAKGATEDVRLFREGRGRAWKGVEGRGRA